VFPIGDENAGTTIKPWVNWGLIALNALVFLYELSLPPLQLDAFFNEYAAIPALISQGRDLSGLLTSMFMHGGWAHILGNMVFLLIFGDNVEDAMGHISYLLFYLLCGLVAGLTQVFLSPHSLIPLIGASGAISGVLGAYLVMFPQGKVRALFFIGYIGSVVLVPAWVMLGLWFVFQLVSGVLSLGPAADVGGVAFWAHVGGFVAGIVLVWVFRDRDAVARQNAVRGGQQPWRRLPASTGGRSSRR
jgi:membrane associated rhomboid family serine protease